ncbi:MAG: 3'-5' exonuclease, partial [Myxococcaceae bacterium]
NLLSVRTEGPKPVLVACATALQQAQFVAQRISELVASGVALGEIAVLYRAHKHSIEIKEALNKQKIVFGELMPSRDWSLDGQEITKSQDRVTLSSIHQAKGLEWGHVFVIWLVEGHFPSFMAYKDPNGLEEERRLFYVALTRAKDSLTFCYPQERSLRRSRFIEEIASLCETWNLEQPVRPKTVRKRVTKKTGFKRYL